MAVMVTYSSAYGRLSPDAVSEVLQDLRLTSASYGRYQMTAPWGLAAPPESGARFHFVVEGGYWLRAPASPPVRVEAGDVVLLAHGTGHVLVDPAGERAVRPRPLEELPLEQVGEADYRMRTDRPGARSEAICCMFDFDELQKHPLLQQLPEVLLLRGGVGDPTLPLLLETMAAEVSAQRIGAATVVTRIADTVITQVVRAWMEGRTEEATGWLAAIRDPQIGRALAAIHRHTDEPWSVETLAALTSLSRSTFAERFAAVVGVSPAHYLARWRMHVAARWLRHDGRTVAEVAARLGYASEASFSRAFKRVRGVPPGVLRRPSGR